MYEQAFGGNNSVSKYLFHNFFGFISSCLFYRLVTSQHACDYFSIYYLFEKRGVVILDGKLYIYTPSFVHAPLCFLTPKENPERHATDEVFIDTLCLGVLFYCYSDELVRWLDAVSYTHLDVYKRQET